jgi:hypothetical protein
MGCKDPEVIKQKRWEYNEKHRAEKNAHERLYNKNNPEKISAAHHRWYDNMKSDPITEQDYRIKRRDQRNQIKLEVLTHYGNGRCQCVMCGESRPACLSIDHINGNGYKLRKSGIEKKGRSLYPSLKKQGYPKGYQTLCMNCQFYKRELNQECQGSGKRSEA